MIVNKTSLSLSDETILMDHIADGSETATRKVVSLYLDYVVSLSLRIVRNHHDAEEIAQEVFLKLFKHAHNWKGNAKISTWLYRVTYNQSIDHLRVNKKHQKNYELKDFFASLNTQETEEDFSNEDIIELEEAMGYLPVKHRTALTLFYFEGKKIKQAAEIMDMSEDAFESLLRRSRVKLKKVLQNDKIFGDDNEDKKIPQNNIFKTGGKYDYPTNLLLNQRVV